MEKINHSEVAVSRLATQFKESPNLISVIRLLLAESEILEDSVFSVIEERYLENAYGYQLDIIGEIVGQSRELIDASLFEYFGFDGDVRSKTFSSKANPSLGGRFRSRGEPIEGIRTLSDVEYRSYIKARISKNKTRSTPEDIISQIQFIFDAPLVILNDGDTEYTLSIGKLLSINEKAVLFNTDIIPKTLGVRVNYTINFNGNRFFAFVGIPNSSGFGSISNSNIGGELGSLI